MKSHLFGTGNCNLEVVCTEVWKESGSILRAGKGGGRQFDQSCLVSSDCSVCGQDSHTDQLWWMESCFVILDSCLIYFFNFIKGDVPGEDKEPIDMKPETNEDRGGKKLDIYSICWCAPSWSNNQFMLHGVWSWQRKGKEKLEKACFRIELC